MSKKRNARNKGKRGADYLKRFNDKTVDDMDIREHPDIRHKRPLHRERGMDDWLFVDSPPPQHSARQIIHEKWYCVSTGIANIFRYFSANKHFFVRTDANGQQWRSRVTYTSLTQALMSLNTGAVKWIEHKGKGA